MHAAVWLVRVTVLLTIAVMWTYEQPTLVIAQNQTPECTAAPLAIDGDSVTVSFVDRLNARVSWEAPQNSRCTGYGYRLAIQSAPVAATVFPISATTTQATIGWPEYQPRWLQIQATNPRGVGPATELLGPFQRKACVDRPPAPTEVRATRSSIEWDAITVPNCTLSYVVTAGAHPTQPLPIHWWPPTTEPEQELDLPSAPHPWYLRVYAQTAAGWSGPSAPVMIDVPLPPPPPPPAPPPAPPYPPAPSNVRATVEGRTLTVTWEIAEPVDQIWLVALPSETSTVKLGEAVILASTSFTHTFDQPFSFWLRVSTIRGLWVSQPSPRIFVQIP